MQRLVPGVFAVALAVTLGGCAAQPRDVSSDEPSAVDAAAAAPVEVVPVPPPGVPMDVLAHPAPEPASLWTRVRTEGQLNLATGAQLVNIQLRGEAAVEPPLLLVGRRPQWRVTEAIDQDGRPIDYRHDVDAAGPRLDISALEYAEAYLSSLRGDALRRLPIELQLSDLSERPRVIRKLTVVGEAEAIRAIAVREFEGVSLGVPVEVEPGITATVQESSPLETPALMVAVRSDPLRADPVELLVVGAGLADAAGHVADAVAVDGGDSPGVVRFRTAPIRDLKPPLRVRLVVATDVGRAQITCVAHAIPVP